MQQLYKRELSQIHQTNLKELENFEDATVIVRNEILRDALNVKLLIAHASRLNQAHLYYSTDTITKVEVKGRAVLAICNLPT
jgi:hypothetical protein